MMALKSFFRRISKDFHHKELMPLKIIFFVQTSTLYILYPYLTIHMRELGISVEETAIMSAITPFVAIIMPPVAGLIADRIGNFKILLSLFSALGGAAALLLLLVPIGRVTVNLPESVVLDVSCLPGSDGLVYRMSQEHPCDTLLEPHLDLTLQSCGYACDFDERNETMLRAMLESRDYVLSVFNEKTRRDDKYEYSISTSDMPEAVRFADMDLKESRNLKNVEFYRIATRQLSKSVLFFPAHRPQLFGFACDSTAGNASSVTCGFDSRLSQVTGETEVQKFGASVKALKLSEEDSEERRRRYLGRGVRWQGDGLERAARCSGGAGRASVSLRIDGDGPQLRSDSCSPSCVLTAPRGQICSNPKMKIEYNIRLTFWAYLVIRVFIGMIGGTAFAMFEGAVIAILREQKADYGLQRIYGSIGGMISSPLSGLLIDYASGNRGYADFRPAFYLYATLKIFSGALMLMINLEFKAPASNVVSDVVSVLKNIEVVALLTACFVLGTAWGYIESFLFWFLEDLGASRTLMGITITVGGIAGIPLLVMSGPIISRIGHANVIFIGFVFYAIRLLGYSLIYNPWLCLIFEALESVTSSLSFTAAVTYAAKLSTTTTDTSIQGLLGGLYYGVGKGAGSLIGGFLMKAVGTRPTYQIFAAMTLFTGFIYLLFNLLYLARQPQVEGNDIVKKKPKDRPVQENGSVGNLEGDKSSKEKMSQEVVPSEPYIVEDMEAINNAKNLEIIESVATLDDDSPDERDLERNGSNQMRLRHRAAGQDGTVNPAFEVEEVSVADETKSSK